MKHFTFCVLLCASLYAFKEPYKPRAKQLCKRSNVITAPQPKQGKLFEKPIRFYEMPRYKYKTGFPLTNNDYMIIRL